MNVVTGLLSGLLVGGFVWSATLAYCAPSVPSTPPSQIESVTSAEVASGTTPRSDESGSAAVVYRVRVVGPITPATVDYLRVAMESAHRAHAAGLVVVIDTPGGLLESTRLIVQGFLQAPLPILVYVSPGGASATSAGVFLTMAAHIAAMAPGTSIGAAHPVGSQGQDIEGEMGKKVENFTAGFGTAIAQRRGRNVAWAEKPCARA